MKKTIFAFLVLFLSFTAGSIHAREDDSEVRTFNVGSDDPAVVMELFEGVKSEDGTITLHEASGKIIVVDYPENIRRMEAARQKVEAVKKAIRLDVLEAELTDWFISRVGLSDGIAVFTPGKFEPMPYMIKGSEKSGITGEFILMAESGKPAFLNISQERLFRGTVVRRADGIKVVQPSEMEVGTSLELVPVVNSDGTITVSIYPVLSEYDRDDVAYGRVLLARFTMNSGDTLFFGGLNAVRTQASRDGIPFRGGTGWGPFSTKQSDTTVCLFITVNMADEMEQVIM